MDTALHRLRAHAHSRALTHPSSAVECRDLKFEWTNKWELAMSVKYFWLYSDGSHSKCWNSAATTEWTHATNAQHTHTDGSVLLGVNSTRLLEGWATSAAYLQIVKMEGRRYNFPGLVHFSTECCEPQLCCGSWSYSIVSLIPETTTGPTPTHPLLFIWCSAVSGLNTKVSHCCSIWWRSSSCKCYNALVPCMEVSLFLILYILHIFLKHMQRWICIKENILPLGTVLCADPHGRITSVPVTRWEEMLKESQHCGNGLGMVPLCFNITMSGAAMNSVWSLTPKHTFMMTWPWMTLLM